VKAAVFITYCLPRTVLLVGAVNDSVVPVQLWCLTLANLLATALDGMTVHYHSVPEVWTACHIYNWPIDVLQVVQYMVTAA
jgi:hypothetical protein